MAVMSHLAEAALAPDLELLARALAEALPGLPHTGRLAVAIDPDRASLLDRNWTRQQDNCLVVDGDAPPRWVKLPGGWNPLAVAVRSHDGAVVHGSGSIPGGAPWSCAPVRG